MGYEINVLTIAFADKDIKKDALVTSQIPVIRVAFSYNAHILNEL